MTQRPAAGSPEFLVAGHVVQDLVSDKDTDTWRLGGAVSYASTLARKLGLRAAVLTAASPDLDLCTLLPDTALHVIASERSTAIRNIYEGLRRRQLMPRRAATLTAADVPPEWRNTPIVLLGPVAGEIDASLAAAFPGSLVGGGAQGWLREAGPDAAVRPVSPHKWQAQPILQHLDALFLSDEDVLPEEAPDALERWSRAVRILAFTHGEQGADVCVRGEWRHIGAFPAKPVDLTGAGDVFAAGFLVSLHEQGDPWQAARFASAAASFVVEGVGIEGVPERAQVEARLREHPDIRAQ